MPGDHEPPAAGEDGLDIIGRLQQAAGMAEEAGQPAMAALLREAAQTIETLQTLVGLHDEILDEIEPHGRA